MKKLLYRFYWDRGRGGDIHGLFVATQEEVLAALGKQVNFGSVLGKHSEVYGDLESKDLEVLSDDQVFIALFEEAVGKSHGYNPMDYLPETR